MVKSLVDRNSSTTMAAIPPVLPRARKVSTNGPRNGLLDRRLQIGWMGDERNVLGGGLAFKFSYPIAQGSSSDRRWKRCECDGEMRRSRDHADEDSEAASGVEDRGGR